MRVFVTGATGFIGVPVVKELIAGGHSVLGLTRSEEGAALLTSLGAEPHRGTLEDLESLKSGAAATDAVIHLAFVHDFSKFQENCVLDGHAIEAMGSVLAGTQRPLIVTSGLAGLSHPGEVVNEDHMPLPNSPMPRVSEQTAISLLSKGVSTATVRLPQVHDTHKQGLVSYAIALAREKGVSAYVGEGTNSWAAAHVNDVARLYKLALEKHEPGARYHAVAEKGVSMRAIAEVIGRGLKIPAVSITAEEVPAHFGWLGMFMGHDLTATSQQTQAKLGWTCTGPGLIEDLENMDFS